MKERTWTIGSSPGCDIRVNSPTVSGQHCQLTQRGQTFILEDLASTNGTFVAGERIDQPRSVRHGEKVTLGLSTPMPWPNLCSITVGRLSDNDVAIPLDMVSGRHARLEREGNRVFLIDLDSRNGTALNDPLNKISRAAIQPGDAIFLGTHKVLAAELLAALPEDAPGLANARQATKLEALPLADMGVKPFARRTRDRDPGAARFFVQILSVGSLLGAGDRAQHGLRSGCHRRLLDIPDRFEG